MADLSPDDVLYLGWGAGGAWASYEIFAVRAANEADAAVADADQVVRCAQTAGEMALPDAIVVRLDGPDCDTGEIVEQLETGEQDNFELTIIPDEDFPFLTQGAVVEGGKNALILMAADNANDARMDRTDNVWSANIFSVVGGAALGMIALAILKGIGQRKR